MNAVINFMRGGGHPHAPLAGAASQTLRFYSGIECLMVEKLVYKIKKKKSSDHFNENSHFGDDKTQFLPFFVS